MDPKLKEKQMKLERIKKLKLILVELQKNPTPENQEKAKQVAEMLTQELKSMNVTSVKSLKQVGQRDINNVKQNSMLNQTAGQAGSMAKTILMSQLIMGAFGYASAGAKFIFGKVSLLLSKINWGQVAAYAGIAAICFFIFKYVKRYFDKQKDEVSENSQEYINLYNSGKITLQELTNKLYDTSNILYEVETELSQEPLTEGFNDGMFDNVTGFMGNIISFKSNPYSTKGKLVSGMFTFLWVVCIGAILWMFVRGVSGAPTPK